MLHIVLTSSTRHCILSVLAFGSSAVLFTASCSLSPDPCSFSPAIDASIADVTAAALMPVKAFSTLETEVADWVKPQPGHSGYSVKLAVPDISSRQLLSLEAVQTPLDSLLFALSKDSGLGLELHQNMTTAVTLSIVEKPLETILRQLAGQEPMRWKIVDSVLHIWGNTPYVETYSVNYLNLDRSTRSSVGLATQVGTINVDSQTGVGGTSNNSQTRIENTADHRFWDSLAADMAVLTSRGEVVEQSSFTINRDVGLLNLYGSVRLHQEVKFYLQKLNASAHRQVLIEATVVEVTLSDRFSAGIDWQVLADGISGISAVQVLTGAPQVNATSAERVTAPNGLFSFVQQNGSGSVNATLSLLRQFGDVRILSRPRIIALNNQSSVLKVVDNRVYFTVNVERHRTEKEDEVITATDIHTVPVGLVMNVTPYIDEYDHIMLNVRPTLSRILGFANDPNPELAAANVKNSVPEIQVREMESMLRVSSGKLAIIGGLMQDVVEESETRLPGLGSIPLLGHLFTQRTRQRRQTELLIVLRPTVMHSPRSAVSMAKLSE